MVSLPRWIRTPFWLCLGSAGLLLGGLLIGFEPVGGDPDRMYRPLKQELARSLAAGRLPWWSDRLGLGLPVLAESHVAALYPPNWGLYRLLGVSAAYRLAMWFHYLLLAAATFGYARFLGVSAPGAALAGAAFPFCGFQAIHSSHEPFYHALAYLPLILLAAEWTLASGRLLGMFLVAVLWAMQVTLGHFQIQWWTAGLVLLLGIWRPLFDGRPWWRFGALALALGLGASAVAVQLGASWELARFVGFTTRSTADLSFYGFPPEHLAEAALPGLARGIPGGPEAGYWYALGTTGYEACFYVGTIPLILALLALGREAPRSLRPWLLICAGSLVLAVLPRTWPQAQALLVRLPGFGWFRAPGRYAVLASLGLCLLAGRGLDVTASPGRLRLGWAIVAALALAASGWSVFWVLRPQNWPVLGGSRLAVVFGTAALAWATGLGLVLAWRRGHVAWWVLLLSTLSELGALYYTSTTVWGWAVRLPAESKMLVRLSAEPGVGRVAGLLHDLPVRAGKAPIYPYTGFAAPAPHPFLDFTARPAEAFSPAGLARLLRHGATHGLWDRPITDPRLEVLLEGEDPILDRLVFKPPGAPPSATWRLVRYVGAFPRARAALRTRFATSELSLLAGVDYDPDPQTVWYAGADRPPPKDSPRATSASIVSYDGESALVEHDGPCDLVLSCTYYPGWFASVNDGPEQPVARAELGIQCVHLAGRGASRVRLVYRPTSLGWTLPLSLGATGLTLAGLLLGAIPLLRRRQPAPGPEQPDRQEDKASHHRLRRHVER
jgi:hypothetical protein